MWFFCMIGQYIYIYFCLGVKMCRFYPKKVLIMQHIRDLLAGREKRARKSSFHRKYIACQKGAITCNTIVQN